MCGIVARSAGLFQNAKKVSEHAVKVCVQNTSVHAVYCGSLYAVLPIQICTCDGVTIWEEAEKNKKLSSQATVASSSRL